MKTSQKLFVITLLAFASIASGQEKAENETALAQAQALTAPPPAINTRPADSTATPATMPAVEGKISVPAELVATAPALPDTLKGRWAGNGYGQAWSVKKAGSKWTMEWWRATQYGCSISDAPAVVKMKSATTLEVSMPAFECMKDFVAVLERSGGEFKGRASLDTGMKLDVAVTLQ